MKISLVVFFLCSVSVVSAQKGTIKLLRGKIVVQGVDVTGITVQNISSQRATITDFEGNFSIQVRVNDTLVFSAVQLQRKVLPIHAEVYRSGYVNVTMRPFVNELREVVVQPYSLSGNLSTDASTLKAAPVTAENLGLPNAGVKVITQSERKLFEATSGFGLVPLNPIINWITGRTKMLKKRVAIDKKYAQTQAVEASIVDSLFLNELRIPKKNIADFMYFCEVDPDFQQLVAVGDQLKLWEYLLRRSQLYRKNYELD